MGNDIPDKDEPERLREKNTGMGDEE